MSPVYLDYRTTIRRKTPVRDLWIRRAKIAAATGILALPISYLPAMFRVSTATLTLPAQSKRQVENNVAAVMPLARVTEIAPKRIHFASGEKDARDFQSLNSYYVGKARVRVDWTDVDLTQNVRYMWARKLATRNVSPATQKSVAAIMDRYEASPHVTTTLSRFIDHADDIVDQSDHGIDFERLCSRYRIDDRCPMVEKLADRINGKMLIAYGMTELFPSEDGNTNKRMLDMMLRRAGEDYINAIPALGDRYLSMGFYQFTSFAVRHDEGGRQGANVVAQFTDRGLPGSVIRLSNDDQHRAAFYFATYNIALMVRSLNTAQYRELQRGGIEKEDLTVFMAAAHHIPRGAQRGIAAWLQEKRKHDLREYLRGDLRTYGKKSIANYEAI